MIPRRYMFLLAMTAACSSDGDDWERALPGGSYAVSPPICFSTGKSPDYPEPRFAVALNDFSNLSLRTIEIVRREMTESFATAECTLQIRRDIIQNYDDVLQTSKGRRHTFTPATCALTVSHQGRHYTVSPSFTTHFSDSDSKEADIPWEISKTVEGWRMISPPGDPWTTIWKNAGCPQNDRLLYDLTAF